MIRSFLPLLIIALSLTTKVRAQDTDSLKIEVHQSDEISRMMLQFIDYNKANRSLKGFRVQIYNGGKTESQKFKSEFVKNFPEVRAYTVYEYPEYRIQVGDYRDELGAERALIKIRALFPGSFTVSSQINWPEL